jgi:hypothetical protein
MAVGFMIAQATLARVIRDKAYDSDRLDRPLIAEGVEMIAPNRLNRSQTQDGRPCDATNDAGPSNAPSLGSKTAAAFASYGKNLILAQGFLHVARALLLIKEVLG